MKNAFRIQLLLRTVLILVFGYAGVYFLSQTELWLVACWMFLFALVGLVWLISYTERSNRELAEFLLAVSQSDFSRTYPAPAKSDRLHYAFQTLTGAFLALRKEKEAGHHFLQAIVDQSGVPLLAWEEGTQRISFTNQALLQLFDVTHLKSIESVRKVAPHLPEQLMRLRTDARMLLKIVVKNELHYLSVTSRRVIIEERAQHFVAFHVINSELDQNELESWQKLMRVMTHEIKNSVIPISTLAEVTNDLARTNPSGWSADDWDDLKISLQTIEKRSKGLVKFVSGFGEVAKMPQPQLAETDIIALVKQVVALETPVFDAGGVMLHLHCADEKITLQLDAEMIEQVLINLLKNALEAFTDVHSAEKTVHMTAYRQDARLVITIADNGAGMSDEILEQIFIPFFTTKTKGTGVGLSYCKQVMRAHKGNLKIYSEEGKGTRVILHFWCL